MARSEYLSKTRYVAGLQCPKMLWWKVHEPDTPELAVDADTQAIFDTGHRVGAAAQAYVPGGVLIDVSFEKFRGRVDATRVAIDAKAPAVYEASFMEDGVFVAVDILERRRGGFALIEVKSTLDVKDHHIPDVGVQLHVLRRAGLAVKRAEVMHLNRDCRHPDLSNLFVRADVTPQAEKAAEVVPERVDSLLAMLSGQVPTVETGPHCTEPYECPFMSRCWPALRKHDVRTLYRLGKKRSAELADSGYETVMDLPDDFEAHGPMRRQIDSVKGRKTVVEPGLKEALQRFEKPIAFLDFETISPAIPCWPDCAPYESTPVQFSCHVQGRGRAAHHEWLADGPEDPRAAIATALLDACEGARTILAYNASFERGCIGRLATAVPRLASKLGALSARIEDLLPVVRDHVYHPDFGGSFSIKAVFPALVGGVGYGDLEISDGGAASAALEGLLLAGDEADVKTTGALRKNLLAYCKRDTQAMVKLHARLRKLARMG